MNKSLKGLSGLLLTAVFTAASALAQSPPQPGVPAPSGFIPRAIDFFTRHEAIDNPLFPTYDFGFEQHLKGRMSHFSLLFGTLRSDFNDPRAQIARITARTLTGLPDEATRGIRYTMGNSSADRHTADGVAAGIKFTWGK